MQFGTINAKPELHFDSADNDVSTQTFATGDILLKNILTRGDQLKEIKSTMIRV